MRWLILALLILTGCAEDPVPVTMTGTWDVLMNGQAMGIWRITDSDGSLSGKWELGAIPDYLGGTCSQGGDVVLDAGKSLFVGKVDAERRTFTGQWKYDENTAFCSATKR